MKKLGPLNLSVVRERALKGLVDSVVESGAYPPTTSYDDKREISAVRDLLRYRVIRRQKALQQERHDLYKVERALLLPLAIKISEKKMAKHAKPSYCVEKRDSLEDRFKCEAMDVLSYLNLGSRHTWLERELKSNPDFVQDYLKEVDFEQLTTTPEV